MIDIAVLVVLAGCGLLVWLAERRRAASTTSIAPVAPAAPVRPAAGKVSATWASPLSGETFSLTPGGSVSVVELGGTTAGRLAQGENGPW
jgi:hypothetical protein